VYVPVVDKNQKPLMPTTPSRARRWVKSGKATPFWKKGVFCVRLNEEPSDDKKQPVACGIDPGSKKEGLTVKSAAHTYLNVQADAVTWVKKHIEQRRMMRRNRRYRNCPHRANRTNRARSSIAPSTKARWQWKLRLVWWLARMYPITQFMVEDVKAHKKTGNRQWNTTFSQLEVGKNWFYDQLSTVAPVKTILGRETKKQRDILGLQKSKHKLDDTFEAHCVDSWVLANQWTGGHTKPDNTGLLFAAPLELHRRQLHRLQFRKDGKRPSYGGTVSVGFKRGSLIRHSKWGLSYIGGSMDNRITLHSLTNKKRLCRNAKPLDCSFLTHMSWRTYKAQRRY